MFRPGTCGSHREETSVAVGRSSTSDVSRFRGWRIGSRAKRVLVEPFRTSNHMARTVGWAKARTKVSVLPHGQWSAVPTRSDLSSLPRGHGAQERAFAHPTDRFHGIDPLAD